jgi:hypothetical protein
MDAERRRKDLAKKTGYSTDFIDSFVLEFNSMRQMMRKQLKGADLDVDPNQPPGNVELGAPRKIKKTKPTRGGGMGFGSK